MGQIIITIKVMPKSPELDLNEIEKNTKEVIIKYVGEGEMRVSQEPLAFGLNSLNIIFVMDEADNKLNEIEEEVAKIEGVNSIEVTDVRKAIG